MSFIIGLLFGAVVGSTIGLIVAPKQSSEVFRVIQENIQKIRPQPNGAGSTTESE